MRINCGLFNVCITGNNLNCLKYLIENSGNFGYDPYEVAHMDCENACTKYIEIIECTGPKNPFRHTEATTALSDKFNIHGGVIFDISKRSW
jgi:hypothetical protein